MSAAEPRVLKPVAASGEPPVFLREVIAAQPAGARVLDAGCGPGSWPYALRPDLDITGFDIKFPPGPPPLSEKVRVFRADLARLPLRPGTFDLVVCHYVLEHVSELEACCDELARLTRQGGTLYLSVPRAAAFDDRLYRFAGYFAKYALMKFRKRVEHQQRFDLPGLLALFRSRGMEPVAHAFVNALVPAADEHEVIGPAELLGHRLAEAVPLGGEEHDHALGPAHALDCCREWFGLQHHAGAAAERVVVDRAVDILREVAGIDEA